ncbi:MAG: hypothetical protein ABIS17_04420 [Casimicrobiaceae bacterium]
MIGSLLAPQQVPTVIAAVHARADPASPPILHPFSGTSMTTPFLPASRHSPFHQLFARLSSAGTGSGQRRVSAALRWLLVLCLPLVLVACGGGGKAAPPTQVTATAGDSSVTLTWNAEGGVDYWIFYAPDPSISAENFVNVSGSRVIRNATSPYTVTGLVNGIAYSFTLNGRTGSGAGGAGSPVVTATPRAAGLSWTVGTPLGTGDLNAIEFGAGAGFVTVGAGGQVFSSADGRTYTARTAGVTNDLNGVAYRNGFYVAVGSGGIALRSADAVTWTAATAATQNLLAIAKQGSIYVAVGANGTIVSSTDAQNWTARVSGTTATLRGAALGGTVYVVVGDAGTVLTSTDLVTWTRQASGVTADLRKVTYGLGRFVAVGDQGTIIASVDGVTWTAATNPTTESLNAVVAGSQFVAAGVNGRIVVSADGLNWTPVASGTTATLLGLGSGGVAFAAVGVAGTNLTSY